MKRTLIALSLLAVAASLYGDSITLNQGIATDNNNARVHLNAVKNADGSYSLATAGGVSGGTQRTWTLSTGVTTSGSVPAGAIAISIVPSSDFTGTINGAAVTGTSNGAAFSAKVAPPDSLPEVAYTRSAGSLNISVIK